MPRYASDRTPSKNVGCAQSPTAGLTIFHSNYYKLGYIFYSNCYKLGYIFYSTYCKLGYIFCSSCYDLYIYFTAIAID
jgi:hypothetical protein